MDNWNRIIDGSETEPYLDWNLIPTYKCGEDRPFTRWENWLTILTCCINKYWFQMG